MTTLYLHIGTHRTATSSVQAFILSNWDALLARGFFHPLRVPRHFALFNAIFSGRRTVGDVARDLGQRAGKHGHDVHSIILSDEDVCMRTDLSVLAEFSEHFAVKVIFALRRQDLWLESWYLQNIKWQWNKSLSHLTLDDFMARADEFHWAHYDRLLTHLDALFGQENVLPYVFEKAQMPNGPVAAFCDRIGLHDLTGLTPAPHVNSSHSPSIAEFVRLLPLDEAPDKYRARLEGAIRAVDKQLTATVGGDSSLLLDHATRSAVLAAHAEGNRNVARRYFGRDDLFLEPVPDPDAALARMKLPPDSETLMRDYVAPMIRGLIKQYIDSPTKT
jgi:hypothetical protein